MSDNGEPLSDYIRVLIADDHQLVTDSISMYLSTASRMWVTTAATLDEAVSNLRAYGSFDVVLLDFDMPGMNGVDGLIAAIELNDGKPVAVFSANATSKMLQDVMNAGGMGIMSKASGMRALANAIRFMHAGEFYVPPEFVRDRDNR
jgi:DNA-binding NarL/FixJ family response regulator